jgi:hypothetical protein
MDNTIGINGIINLKLLCSPRIGKKNILKVYTASQTLNKRKKLNRGSELAK